MTKEKRELFRYVIYLNLFIGLYNMYLWGIEGNIFFLSKYLNTCFLSNSTSNFETYLLSINFSSTIEKDSTKL